MNILLRVPRHLRETWLTIPTLPDFAYDAPVWYTHGWLRVARHVMEDQVRLTALNRILDSSYGHFSHGVLKCLNPARMPTTEVLFLLMTRYSLEYTPHQAKIWFSAAHHWGHTKAIEYFYRFMPVLRSLPLDNVDIDAPDVATWIYYRDSDILKVYDTPYPSVRKASTDHAKGTSDDPPELAGAALSRMVRLNMALKHTMFGQGDIAILAEWFSRELDHGVCFGHGSWYGGPQVIFWAIERGMIINDKYLLDATELDNVQMFRWLCGEQVPELCARDVPYVGSKTSLKALLFHASCFNSLLIIGWLLLASITRVPPNVIDDLDEGSLCELYSHVPATSIGKLYYIRKPKHISRLVEQYFERSQLSHSYHLLSLIPWRVPLHDTEARIWELLHLECGELINLLLDKTSVKINVGKTELFTYRGTLIWDWYQELMRKRRDRSQGRALKK